MAQKLQQQHTQHMIWRKRNGESGEKNKKEKQQQTNKETIQNGQENLHRRAGEQKMENVVAENK